MDVDVDVDMLAAAAAAAGETKQARQRSAARSCYSGAKAPKPKVEMMGWLGLAWVGWI